MISRVQHAVVSHGDAVVDGDGVELPGHPTGLFDGIRHDAADIAQPDMARHELGEAIGDRHDRLAEVGLFEPGRQPQGPGAGHVAAIGSGARTQLGHGIHSLADCGPAYRLRAGLPDRGTSGSLVDWQALPGVTNLSSRAGWGAGRVPV